ncbi:MAG: bacterial transcriptional activator domain-containing protein [Chloroflexi bacterium]|nr:bacterial transcriptional activator domain-containing protein [Chloroflexota bacterium]MBV9546175.1 bacterial transcriptional activator domain-containing protein [Chloroflexota bacterium]
MQGLDLLSSGRSAAPDGFDAADPPVLLRLLGGFRLTMGAQTLPIRSGGKTEALLVHLGLAGSRGVSRHALLQAIWPHSEAALAGKALNTLVHELKGLLSTALRGASPVLSAAGQYRLNEAAGVAVDVAQFRSMLARGQLLEGQRRATEAAALYERAVELYGGDLTPVGSGAQIVLEREVLRAAYRRVLIRLADAAFARDEFDKCLVYATALLVDDPCREDAHRVVMRCHVRLGERSQAVRHYLAVRQILNIELGVEPEPTTQALFEQIRVNPAEV